MGAGDLEQETHGTTERSLLSSGTCKTSTSTENKRHLIPGLADPSAHPEAPGGPRQPLDPKLPLLSQMQSKTQGLPQVEAEPTPAAAQSPRLAPAPLLLGERDASTPASDPPQMPLTMTPCERRDLLEGVKRPAVCIFGIHLE